MKKILVTTVISLLFLTALSGLAIGVQEDCTGGQFYYAKTYTKEQAQSMCNDDCKEKCTKKWSGDPLTLVDRECTLREARITDIDDYWLCNCFCDNPCLKQGHPCKEVCTEGTLDLLGCVHDQECCKETTTTKPGVSEFNGYAGIVVALIVVVAIAFLLMKKNK